MKNKNSNKNTNCIPTPAECVQWNSGDIEYLGVCDGDFLPEIVWEIVNKLQDIAGEDISQFDLESVLEICNTKAPKETTLITILEVLRDNQVCLYDYIKALEEAIAELDSEGLVEVNLKCFATSDSQGNILGVTRVVFDQLIIDKLCNHETRISGLESRMTSVEEQIENIEINPVVSEPYFTTCITPISSPTSQHTEDIAEKICETEISLGTVDDMDLALTRSPSVWETASFLGKINAPGSETQGKWITAPANMTQQYNNLLVAYTLLQQQVAQILATCCAPSCDKLVLAFTGTFDDTILTLNFSKAAGTYIPAGFEDAGSTIIITDRNGVSITYNTEATPIEMDGTVEIDITGLQVGLLFVTIKSLFNLVDEADNIILVCNNCFAGELNYINNSCCAITNTGDEPVVITLKTCSS